MRRSIRSRADGLHVDLARAITYLSTIGVACLFVLSGFLLAPRFIEALLDGSRPKPDTRRFLLKRFLRIYPLYAAAVLVFTAYEEIYGIVAMKATFRSRHGTLRHTCCSCTISPLPPPYRSTRRSGRCRSTSSSTSPCRCSSRPCMRDVASSAERRATRCAMCSLRSLWLDPLSCDRSCTSHPAGARTFRRPSDLAQERIRHGGRVRAGYPGRARDADDLCRAAPRGRAPVRSQSPPVSRSPPATR